MDVASIKKLAKLNIKVGYCMIFYENIDANLVNCRVCEVSSSIDPFLVLFYPLVKPLVKAVIG